jgi:hypothetical protein
MSLTRTLVVALLAMLTTSASANDRVALAAYCLGSFEQSEQDAGSDTCTPADSEICRTVADAASELHQRLERLRIYVGEAMRQTPAVNRTVVAAIHYGKVDSSTCFHSFDRVTGPIFDGTADPSTDLKTELDKPMATPACQRVQRCNAPNLIPY